MLTEVALQHRVIPGIAESARGGIPAPAATDDGNEWVDGTCWLYCGQRWTRVLWIGPAGVATSRHLGRATRHAPGNRKPQVTGYVTWGSSEPPSGFEPETYALRVRCSGQLS